MADASEISQQKRWADRGLRRVTLHHGPHRWTFRFTPGDERALIQRVVELARDPAASFDWFDASAVCHEIARTRADTPSPQHGSKGPDRSA